MELKILSKKTIIITDNINRYYTVFNLISSI